jgi:hypothetical protein
MAEKYITAQQEPLPIVKSQEQPGSWPLGRIMPRRNPEWQTGLTFVKKMGSSLLPELELDHSPFQLDSFANNGYSKLPQQSITKSPYRMAFPQPHHSNLFCARLRRQQSRHRDLLQRNRRYFRPILTVCGSKHNRCRGRLAFLNLKHQL